MLSADDVYRHDHRLIFTAAGALVNASRPVDVLTVFDSLQAAGHGDETGGVAYLNTVAQNVPSSANVRRYAEIVRAHRIRRDVQALGDEISALAAQENDPAELIESATGLARALAEDRKRKSMNY